ncbi:gephyrin-like molybdotransferase Glp [Nocardioides aequoreus]|uniref:molybdotransferase-like divisome protein Glp n=1 Tax=Nocardioides aequoreus TaxID=397278 RepID=UPI0004C47201|nr:gephyrin-like molybdotransferase Glp [Nocardioides aequoreus]
MPIRSVDEHLEAVLAQVEPLPPIEHPLLDAIGLAVADDVHADVALPRFDNSAMDGYAVLFRDVAEAGERPVHLPVVGEIAAGQTTIHSLAPGTAVRIMTGAPVPAGATAIVPFEWTEERDGEVVVSQAPSEGQHVRSAGEEVAEGDLLLRSGEVIGTRQVGLLAALGRGRVLTSPRPRVVVMSTGAELVEPGRPLAGDQIYDSNSYLLAAAVRAHGGIPLRARATSDEPEAFAAALEDQLLRADLVVTSGGVSKGTHDVVKEVLLDGSRFKERLRGHVDFVEVAMQPGKPQGFGVLGPDATPVFTLPGNPVSSYVSFEVFVVPVLRRLAGRPAAGRRLVPGRLTESVRSLRGRQQLLRAEASYDGGTLRVTPVGGAGSHLIAGLASADALVVLDADVTHAERDDLVPVMLLDPQGGGVS